MATADLEQLDFTIGWCAICARDVLTYPGDEALEGGPPRCVHCDQQVQRQLRSARIDDLPGHGYGLLELQGCGNPSCGGGQCARRQNEE